MKLSDDRLGEPGRLRHTCTCSTVKNHNARASCSHTAGQRATRTGAELHDTEVHGASMITIRPYAESDAESVGRLIAETYSHFNLSFLPPEQRGPFLGPFRHAGSPDEAHRQAIIEVIDAPLVYVAEDGGQVVGVLRGRHERLASLFVRGDRHRQGIGARLVERFEQESIRRGSTVVRVAATLHAVPFYLALGYRRSTGVRSGWSFEGHGLKVQPMKKVLARR